MSHYVREDEVLESFKIPLMDLITNVLIFLFFLDFPQLRKSSQEGL